MSDDTNPYETNPFYLLIGGSRSTLKSSKPLMFGRCKIHEIYTSELEVSLEFLPWEKLMVEFVFSWLRVSRISQGTRCVVYSQVHPTMVSGRESILNYHLFVILSTLYFLGRLISLVYRVHVLRQLCPFLTVGNILFCVYHKSPYVLLLYNYFCFHPTVLVRSLSFNQRNFIFVFVLKVLFFSHFLSY